jgi:hypothetical protein
MIQTTFGIGMAEKRLVIRTLGVFSLMGAPCFFLVCAARGPYAPVRTIDLVVPGVVFAITGTGLLFLRRSAAVVLAVISGSVGLWLGLGSLSRVPFPWEIINLVTAAAAFLPVFALIVARKGFKGW